MPLPKPIGDGVDLRTLVESGTYIRESGAGVSTALNYPLNAAGTLEVLSKGPAIYHRYTSRPDVGSRVFTCGNFNGTWFPWVEH